MDHIQHGQHTGHPIPIFPRDPPRFHLPTQTRGAILKDARCHGGEHPKGGRFDIPQILRLRCGAAAASSSCGSSGGRSIVHRIGRKERGQGTGSRDRRRIHRGRFRNQSEDVVAGVVATGPIPNTTDVFRLLHRFLLPVGAVHHNR